jgi:hypothetical protein
MIQRDVGGIERDNGCAKCIDTRAGMDKNRDRGMLERERERHGEEHKAKNIV